MARPGPQNARGSCRYYPLHRRVISRRSRRMTTIDRRTFLEGACAVAAGGLFSARATAAEFKTTLHKAKIIGPVIETTLKPLKEAGFEGVETTQIASDEDATRARALIEGMGMRVH